METDVSNIYVVANKVTDANRERISSTAEELGLELIGMVPVDEMIVERDLAGEPLFDLPDDSVAVQEVERIAQKLGL
jgi:CO dehydrogenase maturation factor